MSTPRTLRELFRSGQGYLQHTNGACPGYLQTNIAFIPGKVADAFEKFCRSNSSSCPLIFKSELGQVSAPLIGKDVDMRTDLPAYRVLRQGEIVGIVPSLIDIPWDDMVTFHLGCSFSFDDKLVEAGISLNQEQNIHMYVTNIDSIAVQPFHCKLIVTLRMIPRTMLNETVNCTIALDFAHGAPIHIGDPSKIGIDLSGKDILGQVMEPSNKDMVPAFWACGVTSSYAVKEAKLEKSFSHAPGCMFVSDILSTKVPEIIPNISYPSPVVLKMNGDTSSDYHVVLSKDALDALREIEHEALEDLGQRGLGNLLLADDFVKACVSLSNGNQNQKTGGENKKRVAIILGFPIFQGEDPREENDGVAGGLYIAKALDAMGVPVTFIVDSWSKELMKTLQENLPSSEVSSIGSDLKSDFLLDVGTGLPRFSHLVSIERPSPGSDGCCHGMRGQVIEIEPTHLLFEQAQKLGITTIGIGDGGNELGMGKVREGVLKHVQKGDLIGSSVSCNYLVTCGVSNWGGFAMSAGIAVLDGCPVFDRYRRFGIGFREPNKFDDMVMTNEKDEELNKLLAARGFRDGIKHNPDVLSIDSFPYYDVHVKKYDAIRKIAQGFVESHK